MEIEFDPKKDAENRRNHDGLSLSLAAEMDWESAWVEIDTRFPYDELRLNAIVPPGDRLYHVTFTERDEAMRVISVRNATNPEKTNYAQRYR
jgi:uncharacterized DUF497 family protein